MILQTGLDTERIKDRQAAKTNNLLVFMSGSGEDKKVCRMIQSVDPNMHALMYT